MHVTQIFLTAAWPQIRDKIIVRTGFQSQRDVTPCRLKFMFKYQRSYYRAHSRKLFVYKFLFSYKLSDDGASKLRFRRQRQDLVSMSIWWRIGCRRTCTLPWVVKHLGYFKKVFLKIGFCFVFKERTVNCTMTSRHISLNWSIYIIYNSALLLRGEILEKNREKVPRSGEPLH